MSLLTLSAYTQDNIIMDIVGIEKGYTNNPDDHGGATKFGISYAEAMRNHDDLVRLFGWDGTMQNLTVQMAVWMYKKDYWDPLNLDSIFASAPIVAHKLFDISVNMGQTVAGEYLQHALNVFSKKQTWYRHLTIDGNVGAVTIGAFNTYLRNRGVNTGIWHLVVAIAGQQSAHYIGIAEHDVTQETFEDGWQDRVGMELIAYARALGLG